MAGTSDRKRAEEALHAWARVFHHVPWGLVIIDPDTNILVAMNPAFASMHAFTLEELTGKSVAFVFAPDCHGELSEHIRIAHENGHHSFESKHIRKDGSIFPVRVEAIAVKDDNGRVLYRACFAEDITERKRMEEELRRARELLEGKVERQMVRRNPYGLTFRELTVLHLVAAGRADKEIARELGISPLTVHKHVANILGKMNAASRTEAGVRALREGLLD